MKNLFALLLALSISYSIAAQDSSATKRWSIGISISPDVTQNILGSTDGSPMMNSYKDFRETHETTTRGLTSGINIQYGINRRISLETGLQYSNRGYKMTGLTFGDYIDPRKGFIYTSSPLDPTIRYSFKYLGVPLRASFSLGNKKLKLTSSIGVVFDYLIKAQTIYNFDYSTPQPESGRTVNNVTSQYKRANISPEFGIGATYSFSKGWLVKLEPKVRYGLLNIRPNQPAEYTRSSGVVLSLYKNL